MWNKRCQSYSNLERCSISNYLSKDFDTADHSMLLKKMRVLWNKRKGSVLVLNLFFKLLAIH